MLKQKNNVLKQRQNISNIKTNYEISPFMKQLKTFEQRLRNPRPKSKPTDSNKKFNQSINKVQILKYTKSLIHKGITADMGTFQNKQNKLEQTQQIEQKYKQQQLIDKIKNIRAQSRDFKRSTQFSKDESFITNFGFSQCGFMRAKQNQTQSILSFVNTENGQKKPQIRNEEDVSFFRYKKNKRFI